MYRIVIKKLKKDSMPKNDPKKNAEHKRELLRQVAKRSGSNNKKNPVIMTSTTEKKKLKRRLSMYQKKLEVAQSNNNKLCRDYKDLKQANYYLKKENRTIRQSNRQVKRDAELLKEKYQKKFDVLTAQISSKDDLETWLTQKNINDIRDLKNYIDKLAKQYELMSLLFQVQVANNKRLFANLTGQMKGNNKLETNVANRDRKIKNLNREKEKIYKKLSLQKKRNQELKALYSQRIHLQNASPEKLINLLTRRCSTKTFSHYDNLNILVRKYEKVLDELMHEQQQNNYRYGYIKLINENYLLHDVNGGEDIQVSISPLLLENPNFTDGSAVRCRKCNSGWVVEKFYDLPNKINHPVMHKNKQKKNVKHIHNDREIIISNFDELAWTMQKKILVVGNKFSSGFLDELKKYCKVQVMDAYEDGLQQIFSEMHTSDYVFLLIGSVPHAVTEHTKNTTDLNKDKQKVQIFDTPAKYDGVIRLHYLFVNSKKNR